MKKLYLETKVKIILQVDDDVSMQEIQDNLIVLAVVADDSPTFNKVDVLDTTVDPLVVTDSK